MPSKTIMNSARPTGSKRETSLFGIWGWLPLCFGLGWAGTVLASAQDAVSTLNPGGTEPGYQEGPIAEARFNDPAGITLDAQGNLYVADSRNHVIRKVTPDGITQLLAGTPGQPGFANGIGGLARLDTPFGIAVTPSGEVVVSDTGNHVLRHITPSGLVTTLAGQPGVDGHTNGPAALAAFSSPLGLCFDPAGNLWVADSGNHVLRKLTPDLQVVTVAGTPGAWGHRDGPAQEAQLNGPIDVAVRPNGEILVSDGLNHVLRKVTPSGEVDTLAGQPSIAGWADGPGSQSLFWNPAGLFLGDRGDLYVADSLNHAIRKVTPQGWVSTISGVPGNYGNSDGANGSGRFFNPYDLAPDANGYLLVSDSYNQSLRQLQIPYSLECIPDPDATRLRLRWQSIIGETYQLQFRESLQTGKWQDLGEPFTAESPHSEIILSTNPLARFYRLVLIHQSLP